MFVGIEAGERELEVYDSNVSAVGFAGVFRLAGSSVAEGVEGESGGSRLRTRKP